MRHDLKALIKDELVKRFEDVVRDEINRHNIAIDKTDRDISFLKNLFEEHKELLSLMATNNHKAYQDIKDSFEKAKIEITNLQNKYLEELGSKHKEIDSLLKTIKNQAEKYVPHPEFIGYKNRILNEFKMLEIQIDKERKNHKDDMYELHSKLRHNTEEDLKKHMSMLSSFKEDMLKFHEILNTNVVDAECIRRSQKADEKTMFVMEKKIENIYTLIERVNKRIDACPKQA